MGKTKELLQPNPSEYTNSPCPCNQPSICTHGKDYIIVVLCVCYVYNKGLGWDLCTYLFAPKVLSDCKYSHAIICTLVLIILPLIYE